VGVSPFVIAIVALVFGAIVGAAFAFGSPILGIPIALAGIALIGGFEVLRRRRQAVDIHTFREQADAQKTDFTPEDRRTQVPDDV
jgi:uncharacterized membrane protein